MSFSCRISIFLFVPCAFSSTNNFAHAQTLYRMSSQYIHTFIWMYEYIVWVNIGVLTGWKKIKQQHISFVLGYLCMILWKISTAISIKHRILATFNIKKNSILTNFLNFFLEANTVFCGGGNIWINFYCSVILTLSKLSLITGIL